MWWKRHFGIGWSCLERAKRSDDSSSTIKEAALAESDVNNRPACPAQPREQSGGQETRRMPRHLLSK